MSWIDYFSFLRRCNFNPATVKHLKVENVQEVLRGEG